jgi:hypothetical protein
VRAQASRKVEVWWSKSREEPGAHKQRHPVKQRQISIFGETGSTQFFERGFGPALFLETAGLQRRSRRVREIDKGQIVGPRTIDPRLTSLAFGNDRKANDLPLILISLIGAVQSARLGQNAAKSAKACRCHG